MLHAGSRCRMWMGICSLMNLGASSGQITVIPGGGIIGEEVNIQIFGANGVGVVAILVFLICNLHLFSKVTMCYQQSEELLWVLIN